MVSKDLKPQTGDLILKSIGLARYSDPRAAALEHIVASDSPLAGQLRVVFRHLYSWWLHQRRTFTDPPYEEGREADEVYGEREWRREGTK